MTSKLSRHRGHSFLWLREFDQQPGPFFAGFCLFWFHGSKSASVCQDNSGLMKATRCRLRYCTLGQYSLCYGARYIR